MKHTKTSHPLDQPTRGKTARNRLRRVDTWLMMYDPGLLQRDGGIYERAWFVDFGFGEEPFTTLESAVRLRKLNPNLRVLGVEIDATRIKKAQAFDDHLTAFRLGGFKLPLEEGENVRVIRAFNVLRQYDASQSENAHKVLASQLLPGGLLIEGTSNPLGQVWTANIIRRDSACDKKKGYSMEGLLFSTNFRSGFDPGMFQSVLPKNFIHLMVPGERIFNFIEAWKKAARKNISLRPLGLRQWFAASAKELHSDGYDLDLRQKYLRHGFLFWRLES